jgi:hypothetical protein
MNPVPIWSGVLCLFAGELFNYFVRTHCKQVIHIPILAINTPICNVNVEFPIARSLDAMDLQGTVFWIFGEEFDLLLEFFLDLDWKRFVILLEPLG